MKKYFYPAIFSKEGDAYNVKFIDFDNIFTYGIGFNDAYYMAQDAMGLFLDELVKFLEPTLDFSNIELKENQFISFVSIYMDYYRKKYNNKSVKKTLSIPSWLDAIAEKENINFSQLLQEAIKNKLEID